MKVCLVNAPYVGPVAGIWSDVFPPINILSLAAYIRMQRPLINLCVIDGLRIGAKKALSRAAEVDADIYGVSFLTFNGSSAYRFINGLKALRPNAKIVVGGTHVTSLEKDAFEKSKIDFAVHGEGEETFVELIDMLAGGGDDFSRIEGLLHSENGEVVRCSDRPLIKEINSLPFPARDLVDMKDYSGIYLSKKPGPNTHILSGRGCVNHCTFCARKVWKRQSPYLRLRSPENIVEEVKEIKERFGIREFFDMGDEFNSSQKWAIETAAAIADAGLGISWQAFCRADTVSDDMARVMKESGCWLIHLGIESGNQRTLDGIRKNITLEQVRDAAAIFQRNGIKVVGLFMLFNVWEEKGRLAFEGVTESQNTIRLARKMLKENLVDSITCSPAMSYPGSILYDIALRHNLISDKEFDDWGSWDHSWGSVMTLPGISNGQRWIVKLGGIRTQIWALLTSGHLNFSKAIWGRGLGLFKMLLGALAEKIPGISGGGRKGITP